MALIVMGMGCHGLMDVSDPTLVRDSDIANASGANARRLDVVQLLNNSASGIAEDVARLTDEWMIDGVSAGYDALDSRDSQGYETASGTNDQHLGILDQLYYQTTFAIAAVRSYTPDSLRGDFLGQLYAIRGYAVLQIAEDICPGFPLNDVTVDSRPVFSGPLTTDSALIIASQQLDSALKYAGDSVRFVALARVVKGRLLLDQGEYAEAATVVAPVATSDTYNTDGYGTSFYADMNVGNWNPGGFNIAVGDDEGGNGLPFAGAHDPRIPLVVGGTRATDETDTLYQTLKYSSSSDQMTVASGIEARLIEAEAALHAGDPRWLDILNTLRSTMVTPALPPLVAPAETAAQVDLLYRERAFWLYSTGRRLGDLRRLIRNYGRGPETVFPTGAYPGGGTYGTATSIPFVLASNELSNPKITSGCTQR
jgi:hypothetical protein